ncbi:hypothetical protein [uncultured Mediterranean phage uvMED]|nr:hypothetical protein [uncultured Mediterranean phage uvMED]|tara:strand:+ start:14494 stop:15126 length:633 start_codon:yes stop_codon:yes gene_type:complete
MCEPTTLTALSTMAGNFGFQQTAATFATMAGSSTAVAIGQGISAVSGVITSPLTSLGMSLFSAGQQRNAYGLRARQNQYQIDQYKRDAQRKKLETDLREADRKREYDKNYKKNLSIMAFSNVDLSSESYKAFFSTQRDQYLRDVDAIALKGLDDITSARDLENIARIDKEANLKGGKAAGLTTIAKGMLTYSSISAETPDSQSLSKKLLG